MKLKKHRYQMKTYVLMTVIGYMLLWDSIGLSAENADKGDFYAADSMTGIKIQKGNVEKKANNQGSAGRTHSRKNIKNRNLYTKSLTQEEKEILYKVVSMECDTGYEGSLAVISCMMNRTQSDKYSDDLMDVITEESQFTAYYDKETGTYPYRNRKPSEECVSAVEDALYKGKRNIPSYILYFRSSDYEYLKGYETYGQIGDNTYFYLTEDKEKTKENSSID